VLVLSSLVLFLMLDDDGISGGNWLDDDFFGENGSGLEAGGLSVGV